MSESKESFKIYTLHSQKGGVGKTSLAIAIAGLECVYRPVTKTLLIDADMTGTCLWDALGRELEEQEDKWFNEILDADPDEFLKLTHNFTKSGVVKKSTKDIWGRFIFEHDVGATQRKFGALQSNPQYEKVREIVPELAQESFFHFYGERLINIITAACDLGYRTLVIDLPPGLFGFSEAVFRALNSDRFRGELKHLGFGVKEISNKDNVGSKDNKEENSRSVEGCNNNVDKGGSKNELIITPIAVSTMDKMDYRTTFPAAYSLMKTCNNDKLKEYMRILEDLMDKSEEEKRKLKEKKTDFKGINIWFNKGTTRDENKRVPFDPTFDLDSIFKELNQVEEFKIRFDNKKIPSGYVKYVKQQENEAKKTGGSAFKYVPYFSVENICDVISSIKRGEKSKDKTVQDDMTEWVKNVKSAIGLDN